MKPLFKRKWVRFVLLFFLALIIGYNGLFYPGIMERVIKTLAARVIPDARLEFKLVKSSLFFGFEIRDIRLGSASSGKPLFAADRFNLSYFLPAFLIGDIGVREIGLYSPVIYLTREGKLWNYEEIFGKSKPAKKEKSTPLPSKIDFYVPLKFYAHLQVRNLRFVYRDVSRNGRTELDLRNFGFRLALMSESTRFLHLNSRLLDTFKTMVVGLNLAKPLRIDFRGSGRVNGDLKFSWVLYRNEGAQGPEFLSRLRVHSDGLRGIRGGIRLPVGISLIYDAAYLRSRDQLNIRGFEFKHHSVPWLSLSARVNNLTAPGKIMDIQITRSRIQLSAVRRLLYVLAGSSPPPFGGEISLAPLSIRGPLENLKIRGLIRGRGLFFGGGNKKILYRMSFLRAALGARLDLHRALPFLAKSRSYSKTAPRVFGVFRGITLYGLKANFNGADVFVRGSARPGGVFAWLRVKNLELASLSGNAVAGALTGAVNFQSSVNFRTMRADISADINDFTYVIGRSRSGANQIALEFGLGLKSRGNETIIDLREVDLEATDAENRVTVGLQGDLNMKLGDADEYRLDLRSLRADYEKLYAVLPGNLQADLRSFDYYLRSLPLKASAGKTNELPENTPSEEGRLAELSGKIAYRAAKTNKSLRGEVNFKTPFFNRENIALRVHADFAPRKIELHGLALRAFHDDLTLLAEGTLKRKSEKAPWSPRLKASLAIKRKHPQRFAKNILVSGELKLNASVSPKWAKGSLNLENVALEIQGGNCLTAIESACRRIRLTDINMRLPFLHDMQLKNPVKLTEGRHYYALGEESSRQAANFTIRHVSSSHNPRSEFESGYYYFAGGPPGEKGLKAGIYYKKNMLYIRGLLLKSFSPYVAANGRVLWKRRGEIFGKNIFFNAANLEKDKMEYAVSLQIKNLDLEPFLPSSRSNYDGIISADLSVLGHSLIEPLSNTTARLSVFKISPEFSGFLTRIVMPSRIAESLVQSTFSIPSIKVALKGGLVYSTLHLRGNMLLRPSREEIKHERIPLAQFLANARSEVKN